MRVADYIFHHLADDGVKEVFLVTGGGAMFLNNGLLHEKRITPICCHHEQGAAIAAEGNARVRGSLAVVSVTTGPGGTNALTGVIGEWLDSQPVLYLSGQVKLPTSLFSQPDLRLRQLGDQEIPIVDIVKPVTKYAVMVTDISRIRYELEAAIYYATHGRKGPVWLDIPINIQSAEIDPETLEGFTPPETPVPVPSAEELFDVVTSYSQSRAPVIIAGQGIRLSGALEPFYDLALRMKCPLLTTFEGFDMIPSDHPQLIGPIGTIGSRAGNIALQNADWVLCIGSRNNIRQISYNYENFLQKARHFICVDIDEAELNKHTIRPTLKIHADAGEFIRALLSAMPANAGENAAHGQWLCWCRERRIKYPFHREFSADAVSDGLHPYLFTNLLTEALSDDAIIACANATPSLALFQAGVVKGHQRQFCNSGCAAMGYGFPAAIGAAVAARETNRQVICLDGDGSLMMNLQEMQTVSTHHLPVKLFLYNNGEYCSIRQTHDNFFHERIGCDSSSGVEFPDWSMLAKAFGWRYRRLSSLAEAQQAIPDILAETAPVLCDVKLTPGYTFAPKLSSKRLPDGTMVSPSLEDMFPFLPPEEMAANIYENRE